MKRTIILFTLLIAVTSVFAQDGKVPVFDKVTSASRFKEAGKLDKAIEAIEEAIDSNNPNAESSISWPRTWEVRGEIYQAVFNSKNENYKKLNSDPLTVAFDSYMKVIQLDDKDGFSESVKIKFTFLIEDLTNQAIAASKEENYEKALRSYEHTLAIQQTPLLKADDPNAVDTVIIFSAGLAAYNAQNYDKAIEYFSKAAKYKFNGAKTYLLIASSYTQKKDINGALRVLQEGSKEYPQESPLLVEIINIYIYKNQVNEAVKYLEIAIARDPQNAAFYFAQGAMYDKLLKPDDAANSYLTAIKLKEDYFDAYYNLGALYYNKGVKQVGIADAIPSDQPEKYEVEKNKADNEFKKAILYLEGARKINPTDKLTMESLKTLYFRLKMLDKHAEIIEKMKTNQ